MGDVIYLDRPAGAAFTPDNLASPQQSFDDGDPPVTDTVTHRELDARLEAVETRVASRLDKIDVALAALSTDISSSRAEFKGLKGNIWGGVATVIATMLAVGAFALQSFDSGRDTAATQRADMPAPPTIIVNVPPTTTAPQPVLQQSGRKGG